MRGNPLRESFVLREDDLASEIDIGGVPPEVIDGEGLHIDALLIHDLQPLGPEQIISRSTAQLLERRAPGHVLHWNHAVGMTVDHPDPASTNPHLALRRLPLPRRCAPGHGIRTRGSGDDRTHELPSL